MPDDYEIFIVTNDNRKDIIKIPDVFEEKYSRGIISNTHFSDILRNYLLVEYGGTWIDSTVFCLSRRGGYEVLLQQPLFMYTLDYPAYYPRPASSWLISAERGNQILSSVRDLLINYRSNNDIAINYYIYHMFIQMVKELKYPKEWKLMPHISAIPSLIMQRHLFDSYDETNFNIWCEHALFNKLTYKFNQNKNKKGTVYEHILNSYL